MGEHQTEVMESLVAGIGDAARKEVPWFLEQMPPAYFRQVAPARREQHLRAIVALSAQGITVPEVQLKDASGKGFTFISDGDASTTLNQIVQRQLVALPAEERVRRVLMFQSADYRLRLSCFDTYGEGDTSGERRFGTPGASFVTSDAEADAGAKIKAYKDQLGADAAFAASEAAETEALLLGSHNLSPGGGGSLAQRVSPPTSSTSARESKLDEYLAMCPSSYVIGHASTPHLFHQQRQMYEQVAGGDDMAVLLSRHWGPAERSEGSSLLTLAIPQATARVAILRAVLLLNLHGMELQRAQVDRVGDDDGSRVTLLRTVVRPLEGSVLDEEALVRDASRLKWVSDWSFSLAGASPGGLAGPNSLERRPAGAKGKMSLVEAEVALGLADLSLAVLVHPLLSRKHCRERLYTDDVRPIAARLSRHFVSRFDPDPTSQLTEAEYDAALADVFTEIEAGSVSDEQSKQLLRAMASAAKHTLRTNVHVEGRWSLAMRLDPRFFEPSLPEVPSGFSNLPHGTFFVAGRNFNGYHNRFRDISRGGLRVVLPPSEEAHAVESRRHFMECFGLSWAQQLKNKDIPEGGSKGVCLVVPVPGEDRTEIMHACVKRMVDGMLDLIVPSTADQIVTRSVDDATPLGTEHIFLGPDENITPRDLDWIVAHAASRGYSMPSAFMSSKPRAGINHKEYGVTSEGVAVFLGEALRSIGIKPAEEPWTVKLTGGPDGDVAGNMLKILDREYGANVRVVGLADGSACAEDPAGLPMGELLRLFDSSLPLSALDASTLSGSGLLTLADSPAGIAARNTMHNRVVADAFVPAGGRPASMNARNWRDFLRSDGSPSARVIVEGANLFLTPEARLALFQESGLPIVKDSSANKCGVICSSMEIRASMCVSDDDFVAMKGSYVKQVLEMMREMAQLEARLLFAEAGNDPTSPLPAISERISFAILRVSDAVATVMDGYAQQQPLWPMVAAELPDALANSEHAPRLPDALPFEYQKSVVAKSLASRLVYREGLSFIEGMPDARLPLFALSYLESEQKVTELADSFASTSPEVKELLIQGGVRAAAERGTTALQRRLGA